MTAHTCMSDDISVSNVEDCKAQCEAVSDCVGFVTNKAKTRCDLGTITQTPIMTLSHGRCFFRTAQSLTDCEAQFGFGDLRERTLALPPCREFPSLQWAVWTKTTSTRHS